MAVTETTPLVQALDSDASNPPPWGAVALLCIFYATGGVYTIFSVFIRDQALQRTPRSDSSHWPARPVEVALAWEGRGGEGGRERGLLAGKEQQE
ncbi:hypothetical protein AK812_SmicGene19666 [Symbiodinium microadriaticum]|uniref:Uncharacterized protein n=1 Tax=Symbiodinium microadriaticum TaxID=2951 RepID=A0A1Q9DRY4_SYMMI|nr:hypothetical protein AK812_SmicGene19666 [Symbiodinium microadriaticum]